MCPVRAISRDSLSLASDWRSAAWAMPDTLTQDPTRGFERDQTRSNPHAERRHSLIGDLKGFRDAIDRQPRAARKNRGLPSFGPRFAAA